MATNNSSNNQFSNNGDGFGLSGGATPRTLTVTGSNVTVTGSGANTYTMPATTDTLVGRASTDTLTNKDLTSGTNTFPTFNQNTTGTASNVTSTVVVANGGTGAATLTGVVIGNGTSPFTTVSAPAGTIVGTSDTQTLTNKRINPRVNTLTVSSNTYTPNGDTTDTALIATPTANFTIASPTGTPVDSQKLVVRITSGATGYVPTWGGSFSSSGTITLPASSLPPSKTITLGFVYDANAAKWVLLAADLAGY